MANSARYRISYTPRHTDDEAFELCPPQVRKALMDSVNDWSAAGALRHSRKYGWKATVEWLRQGDENFMRKGWEPAHGKRPKVPSPTITVRVKPLRANW